ncbi:hypothetical protein [Kaarinaea lacus]
MTTYVPPLKSTEFIFYTTLVSQADTKLMQSNPTLASGDVTISKDGGSFANLTTLPAVTPASGVGVKVTVSATEMNADNVLIVFSDAAGSEWCDKAFLIQTVVSNQFDDLSTFDSTTDTVDVGKISGDSTAADNAELFFDNTGFAASNSTIGTVSTVTGLNDPSAAAIADAVWDEAIAGHTSSGSTGEALDDASTTGVTAATVADAVWDEQKSGHTTSGSFGEEVQAHATSSEVTQATIAANALQASGTVSIHRGDSYSASFSDLGDLSDRSKLWFTVKSSVNDEDTAAIVQIEEGGGLLYINGGVAGTSSNGDITVTDANNGDITVTLDEVETAKLSENASLVYDIQMLTTGGTVTTLSADSAAVTADVTKATS